MTTLYATIFVLSTEDEGLHQKVDEGLFQRFKDGDPQAFRQIYDQYVGLIQFVAGKFDLSPTETDEVVQESFFRLYKNVRTIKEMEQIKPWLCLTARNYSIDLKRREKRKQVLSKALQVTKETAPGESIDHEAMAIRKEMEFTMIAGWVEGLGRGLDQQTWNQFYRQNLSTKEIARQNQEALGTVTSRLSRLRKKLKESLKERIQEMQQQTESDNG